MKRAYGRIFSILVPAVILIVSFLLLSCVSFDGRSTPGRLPGTSAQDRGEPEEPASQKALAPEGSPAEELPLPVPSIEVIPIDPKVKIGVLDNGLTYYVRENALPKNRAELRLVVNAGSVLEDDDQRGLAHFLEHMAFNGTAHFEKQQIVDYLESIGMRFGPDLNAYTTYDETVYMLQVPTDREDALETAVHILDEWARYMTLDEEQIDKERNVIVEEWRLRRDAESRIREKQAELLYYKSRYAERNPIGDMEIIRTFEPEQLFRFYRDWYRPELMAVIAVGDFDAASVEALIKKHFEDMKRSAHPRERPLYPVPDHKETLFSIVTDSEATASRISIVHKRPPEITLTTGDYRDLLVEYLFFGMLNARLEELSKKPDTPFIQAYSGSGRFVRTKDFSILGAQVKNEGIEQGFESILTEAQRVRRHGFTQSELQRQKKDMLSSVEKIYRERDKIESDSFVSEYVNHYLEGETIPGIEYERELYVKYLPGISLDEVNERAGTLFPEENRVILVSAPGNEKPSAPEQPAIIEKPSAQLQPSVSGGKAVPNEQELQEILRKVMAKRIDSYVDRVSDLPLMAALPEPGLVTGERRIEPIGVTEWVLSNGARVVLKPTDFKNDQLLFGAFSPGGLSVAPDEDVPSARIAADVIFESGVGGFSRTDLEKKLAGKVVEVSPWIDDLYEGVKGSATPEDLETMFQLVYLYFTQPGKDEEAYSAYLERLRSQLQNRQSSPDAVFWDRLQTIMTRENARVQPLSTQMIPLMSLDKSFGFYLDRFADAGDFTFFLVGSFDPSDIRPLVERYLASLPSTGRNESWRDLGIRAPEGVVRANVKKGIEPKSAVAIVFNGPMDCSLENVFLINALGDMLDIPLRETLREAQGGTYNVSVYAVPIHYPEPAYRVYIVFGTAPERTEELLDTARQVLQGLIERGPEKEDVEKVREILKRERETNVRRNEFWLSVLQSYYINGLNPLDILKYDHFLQELSVDSLRKGAEDYLSFSRYVQVVLYPENWSMSSMLFSGSPSQRAEVGHAEKAHYPTQ
jgi:zinc protease